MSGKGVIVFVNNRIYVGTVMLASSRYIKVRAFEPKLSKVLELKLYRTETFTIEPLTSLRPTLEDFKKLSNMMNGLKFIQSFDRTYFDAIEDIEKESFVGISLPGIKGRFSEISVIAISTWKSIYIFDIMILGSIEKTFKTILESKSTKKIIHDSSNLADYLHHRQKIVLDGVFDTEVAHCSLGFDENRSDLIECLFDHFGIPEELFDEEVQWHCRPISSSAIRIAALNVAFLKKLHIRLSTLMLNDVKAVCGLPRHE
ncbi:piRNA biogenesis protein EXD1, partial [Pseudolycoriella hygida]